MVLLETSPIPAHINCDQVEVCGFGEHHDADGLADEGLVCGRLLAPQDQLYSQGKHSPYGEDRYNPSPVNPSNDTEKSATYTRTL